MTTGKMAESSKRRQHFVPRFYLKYFSQPPKRRTISLWNIKDQLYVRSASLKKQAYAHNFCGADGVIEDALGLLESRVSNITAQILNTRELPLPNCEEYVLLCMFLMFQAGRTKAAADDLESAMDQLMKATFKEDPRVRDYLPHVRFCMTNPAGYHLGIIAPFVPLIFDLKAKLAVNTTEHEFITSDNPVIRYNQFMELRKWPGSGTGWSNPGLQILFPLSPRLLLILYDSETYTVGSYNKDIAEITKSSDVNRINRLQFIRADENVYLSSGVTQFHIARMHKRWAKYRRPRVTVNEFKEANPDPNSSIRRSLLVSSFNDIRIGLKLSFVSYAIDPAQKELGPTMSNPRNRYVEEVLESIYGEAPWTETVDEDGDDST